MRSSWLCFHRACLKPAYTLRRQLMLSYGVAAVVSICLVLFLAVLLGARAGQVVQQRARTTLEEQVIVSFAFSCRAVAEQITSYLDGTEGALQLVVEITRDRIVGYPSLPGWETDEYVPFFDTETQRNRYPLKTAPPPLDWNITSNVNDDSIYEHFQDRIGAAVPEGMRTVSTASGVYHFQGSCDPEQTDPSGPGFYSNCTLLHNTLETGGVVQPTRTSQWLHQKSGDIATLIKPIYEAQPSLLLAGVYFFNSGAGSSLWYPGHTVATGDYISDGCDWMNTTTNPHSNQPYATSEEVARCHAKGQVVPAREYNPLDRAWFHDCLEKPDEFQWFGPFGALESGLSLVSVCKGVFDRETGHLIGEVSLDTTLADIQRNLRQSRIYDGTSQIALVRYSDATVFVATEDEYHGNTKVFDTGFISEDDFLQLNSSFAFNGSSYAYNDVIEAFQGNAIFTHNRRVFTAFPLPLPPDVYDPLYYPKFLVLHRTPDNVFQAIVEMDKEISDNYLGVVGILFTASVVGMILVFVILWSVSDVVTGPPLTWISSVASEIVNDNEQIGVRESGGFLSRCTPKTEITDLVTEFKLMLKGFSGEGASHVARPPLYEVPTTITWRSDFQRLYQARDDVNSPRKLKVRAVEQMPVDENDFSDKPCLPIIPAPPKMTFGRNINRDALQLHVKSRLQDEFDTQNVVSTRTSLFWWMIVLIAIPLVLTNTFISTSISINLNDAVPQWISIVEEASLALEKKTLNSTAYLKAAVVESMLQEVVTDLHLLTRTAGWLFFGGIERSDAFVRIDTGAEQCKFYPRDGTCPFLLSNRTSCACEWEDIQVEADQCTDFEGTNTRYLQTLFWHIQATDAEESTGDRNNVSSSSEWNSLPNRTRWWNSTDDLPGAYKGRNASGFETAYDRIRVSSPMAVVEIPIFNYGRFRRQKKFDLGTFVGFEADGGMVGYDGCVFGNVYVSKWLSDGSIAPDLCPSGKFGYDCRCRGWYNTGKVNFNDSGASLHITAPYLFASDNKMATSATSPIANPKTREYFGQTLLDFSPQIIRDALHRLQAPLSFLITPEDDEAGGNTVVGPDIDQTRENVWRSANILDLVFPGTNSTHTSSSREAFNRTILSEMRNGQNGVTEFWRSLDNETDEALLVLAYYPVYARSYQAVSPDDFSRGVNVTQSLVYIVGIAAYDDELRKPFRDIEEDTFDQVNRLWLIYFCLVVTITAIFTIRTCMVTVAITKPLITLLKVVSRINTRQLEDELPPLKGGSCEINLIYGSLTKLVKVVRMSNVVFFSGNYIWAREIVSDALSLFQKLEDTKGIGIAMNNLANTEALIHETQGSVDAEQTPESFLNYEETMGNYDSAVSIGQASFDDAPDEDQKAKFALQLSDRLFNRALYSHISFTLGTAPVEARELALNDLARVREIDADVVDFWLERKLLLKNSDVYFARILRRANGLADLYNDEDVRSLWDPFELVDAAEEVLTAAWNDTSAPIFHGLSRNGQLQQLEATVMRLYLCMGKRTEAARIALRMLVEDEFILESAFASAVRSLSEFLHGEESQVLTEATKASCRRDLRRMMKSCKSVYFGIGNNIVFCFDLSDRLKDGPILDSIQAGVIKLYDGFCSRDDHVGIVSSTDSGGLHVEICSKEDNEGRQRAGLELATSCSNCRNDSILPYATQMLVESPVSTESDSYLLLVTDGLSGDADELFSLRTEIQRLNRQLDTAIHVIILDAGAEKREIASSYRALCTVSRQSFYAHISSPDMDAIIAKIGVCISGHLPVGNQLESITMEKF